MVVKEITVASKTGLHARPATLLVKKASNFKSDITIEYDGKKANVKSLIGVLSLGIGRDANFILTTNGDDEVLASEEICRLLNSIE